MTSYSKPLNHIAHFQLHHMNLIWRKEIFCAQCFAFACPSAAMRLNFEPSVVPTGTGRPDALKLIRPPEEGVANRSLARLSPTRASCDSEPFVASESRTGSRSLPLPE